MVNRFLTSLVVIVLVVGSLLFWGLHTLQVHKLRNEAAALLKKQDISITIVEGKRREEIAAQFDKAGITSYADFMTASANLEGQLFPDTYRFFPNTPASQVVSTLSQTFVTETKDLHPTNSQLVLASIIEREAINNTDRPLIAGVYQNRLNRDMFLGSDPTVMYAKDSASYQTAPNQKGFIFWKAITQADYQLVVSPFNTYLNKGLPPAPIANPGRQSIIAAQNPTQHDYLYFVYKKGKLLLAKTLAEHNANSQQ